MNPIERLTALHDEMRAGKGSVSDMIPIIEELKKRDEAVRKVADFIDVRMDAAIAKLARTSFAHTETSALANNFAAMLSDAKQDAARLRAALEGKHE